MRLIAAGVLLALPALAVAGEDENVFESTRLYGRGRTFVAAYDSNEASRFNPATLAESGITFQLRMMQLDLFVGENAVDTISDLTDISGADDSVAFLRKFDEKFGERQYARGQLALFNMRFGRLEIAPFVSSASWLELHNPAVPNVAWQVDTMAGANISYGFPLGKTFALGITVRPFYRWYTANDITFADLTELLPPSETEFEDMAPLLGGTGVGVDLGMIWTPVPTLRFGTTIHNLGDAEYFQDNGSEPPAIKQKVSLGMLYRKPLGRWNLDLSLDAQGVVNRDGVNLLRLVHAGSELGYTLFGRDQEFGVAVGVNEGYVVGGLFADFWLLRFDLAQYTVETGHYPGQRPDKRMAMTLQMNLTF